MNCGTGTITGTFSGNATSATTAYRLKMNGTQAQMEKIDFIFKIVGVHIMEVQMGMSSEVLEMEPYLQ